MIIHLQKTLCPPSWVDLNFYFWNKRLECAYIGNLIGFGSETLVVNLLESSHWCVLRSDPKLYREDNRSISLHHNHHLTAFASSSHPSSSIVRQWETLCH